MLQEKFKKWEDFRSYVIETRQVEPVYWRGQRNPSWPLASEYERSILRQHGGWKKEASQIYPYDGRFLRNDNPMFQSKVLTDMRDTYIVAFERAASGLRGDNPTSLNREQWWALGRHYGLITPLLDWTEKPFLAAFFPMVELYSEMKKRGGGLIFEGEEFAVFRLFANPTLQGNGLKVVRPIVNELTRMHGQRGLFTWLTSDRYFELQGFLDNTDKGDHLTKITISDQALLDGLRDLHEHGIDHRLLFPDLLGAAQYANTLIERGFL